MPIQLNYFFIESYIEAIWKNYPLKQISTLFKYCLTC